MRVYIVLFIIFVLYLVTRWSAQTGVIEMTEEVKKLVGPRGYRNNNPLNIRVGNDWQGERLDKTDGEFEQFISPEYGFRAGAKVLKNYQRLYNLKTVRQIIGRWAPSNENDTSNYVDFVARELGVSPDAQINVMSDGSTLARLMLAMSVMECGRGWFTVEQSVEGVALA